MDKKDQDKDQVRKAILGGNIEFTSRAEEAINSMGLGDPNHVSDFSITSVTVRFWGPWRKPMKSNPNEIAGNGGGMGIDWMTKSAGCGRADFYIDGESGKLRCYNQAMGKKFLKSLLDYVLENTELDME